MTTLYSYPATHLDGSSEKITISTGPVIVDHTGTRVLLHIGASTLKYQFIGGRLDDTLSPRENAIMKAGEVIGTGKIILIEQAPLVLIGKVERDGNEENIVLMHYLARIDDERDIHDAKWFSLDEVMILDAENKTSSENVRIASAYFLKG